MKNAVFTTLLVFLFAFHSNTQDLSIDIITYSEDKSFLQLEDLLSEALDYDWDCVSINRINSLEEASSDFILELWDSPSYEETYIYYQERTRFDKEGKKQKKYEHGIGYEFVYDIYGRLYERANNNIIDIFDIGKYINWEEKVRRRSTLLKKGDRFQLVKRYITPKAKEEVEKIRKKFDIKKDSIHNNYIAGLKSSIMRVINEKLLPGARVTGIHKQKKEKVKAITFSKCKETDFFDSGLIYMPITQKVKLKGYDAYRKVATCYTQGKEGILNIRKGEKELLPLLTNGSDLYVGDAKIMEPMSLMKYKTDDVRSINFVFQYEADHTFSDFERKVLELLFQSSFIGYQDIAVRANDPFTSEINKSLGQSIYTYDPDNKVEVDLSSFDSAPPNSKTIFVAITKEGSSTIKANASLKIDGEEITDKEKLTQISKDYRLINDRRVFLENIRFKIENQQLELLEIEEEKKDNVYYVSAKSMIPLDKNDVYLGYDIANPTKDDEPIIELKFDHALSKYVGVAKVKEGGKIIKDYMTSEKPITFKRKKRRSILLLSSKSDKMPEGINHYDIRSYNLINNQ